MYYRGEKSVFIFGSRQKGNLNTPITNYSDFLSLNSFPEENTSLVNLQVRSTKLAKNNQKKNNQSYRDWSREEETRMRKT